MDKDTRKVLKKAQAQGFRVERTKKGHHEVRDQAGNRVATFSGTASDWRSWKNSMADLRRAGFKP